MFWFFVCLATRMIVMSKICIVRVSIYVFCWTAYWGFFAEGRSLYQTIICFLWFLFKANCCERAFTVDAFNHQAILAQAITNHTYQASTDHRYWLSLYFFRSELFTWFILFYNNYFLVFFALLLYCLFLYCSFTFAGSGSGETTNHPPQPTFHWGKDWDHYPLFLSSSDIFLKKIPFKFSFHFISTCCKICFAFSPYSIWTVWRISSTIYWSVLCIFQLHTYSFLIIFVSGLV